MAVLSTAQRKKLTPEQFALAGRRYPINDINHGRNALARVSEYGTPDEQARVRAAVLKKYPSLKKNKSS